MDELEGVGGGGESHDFMYDCQHDMIGGVR